MILNSGDKYSDENFLPRILLNFNEEFMYFVASAT